MSALLLPSYTSRMQIGEVRQTSWWLLLMVFMLALLIFIGLRWQPEAWLRAQLISQSQQQGVTLSFDSLHVEGLSVRLDTVSIATAVISPPLTFETLILQPAWSALLSGTMAVRLKANWQGQSGQAVVAWQENDLQISDIHAAVEAGFLQSLWQGDVALPIKTSGAVQLSGELRLVMATGHLVEGRLTTLWQSAAADLAGTNMPLGDYQLIIQSEQGVADAWPWTLSGGTAVVLNGRGTLNMPGDHPQQWMLSGQAEVKAGDQPGGLAAMLGTTPMKFRLSGNVMQPRLQRF